MSTITIDLFAKSLAETNAWIDDYMSVSGEGDPERALHALRATLHALRDQLTLDQNAHLSAQLPTMLRGLYFEAWDPHGTHVRRATLEGFLERISDEYGRHVRDFDPQDVATAAFAVLDLRVAAVAAKIRGTLPKEYRALWEIPLFEV
ncbi:MAG: DUF2267 domain-containing protein [bacterium]|nr:DUF2267 domain-containing protein [bacterium]